MILDAFPNLKALILDMDGVIWRGKQPIGDLARLFSRLDELGLKVVFITNNATGTISQYTQKLTSLGIRVDADQVLNSPLAVASYLKEHFPSGGAVYMIGEDGVREALQQAGFYHAEADVIAVVAGLDRKFNYDKLRTASFLIQHGAPFIGTNPDKTFPSQNGLTPGAGSILAAIETASGVAPKIMGKPYPYLFRLALSRLRTSPAETLVVGDRLDTDILGGHNAGCKTAFVLSGVHTRDDLRRWQPQPDFIAASLTDLIEI
ncbi:MAG: HAD-IIA family hydrolase [Bellilinea sp.]|jgi:4-nitrophenyl phosphatase